jgi:hypothetical protein
VSLLDAHDSAPSVAGRLGLPLEPNLHDAVDAAAHGLRPLDGCVVPILRAGRGRLVVVAGHPSPVAAAHVSTRDVLDVVAALLRCHDFVVVDVEDGSTTGRAILDDADAVVAVAGASPVGVVRVLEWIAGAAGRGSTTPLHLVVNRAPRSRFRQEEIRAEVERTVRPSSVSWLPHDRSVESAAWDGAPVPRGSFRKACARLGQAVDPAAGGGRRRAS